MQTDIAVKNLELNAPLRVFIEEKMGDLDRAVGSSGPASVRVEVGLPSAHHRKGQVFYAEANLTIGGHLLRAEATDYDLHSAIVKVKEDLKVQIKKFKEKLSHR